MLAADARFPSCVLGFLEKRKEGRPTARPKPALGVEAQRRPEATVPGMGAEACPDTAVDRGQQARTTPNAAASTTAQGMYSFAALCPIGDLLRAAYAGQPCRNGRCTSFVGGRVLADFAQAGQLEYASNMIVELERRNEGLVAGAEWLTAQDLRTLLPGQLPNATVMDALNSMMMVTAATLPRVHIGSTALYPYIVEAVAESAKANADEPHVWRKALMLQERVSCAPGDAGTILMQRPGQFVQPPPLRNSGLPA